MRSIFLNAVQERRLGMLCRWKRFLYWDRDLGKHGGYESLLSMMLTYTCMVDLATHLALLQLIPPQPGWKVGRADKRVACANHQHFPPAPQAAIQVTIMLSINAPSSGRKAKKMVILVSTFSFLHSLHVMQFCRTGIKKPLLTVSTVLFWQAPWTRDSRKLYA